MSKYKGHITLIFQIENEEQHKECVALFAKTTKHGYCQLVSLTDMQAELEVMEDKLDKLEQTQ